MNDCSFSSDIGFWKCWHFGLVASKVSIIWYESMEAFYISELVIKLMTAVIP